MNLARQGGPYGAIGLRGAAWAQRWRGRFYVAGGPSLEGLVSLGRSSPIGWITVAGDLAPGGGRRDSFAVFGHLRAGGALMLLSRGGATQVGGAPRVAVGVGTLVFVVRRITVGIQLDYELPVFLSGVVSVGFLLPEAG